MNGEKESSTDKLVNVPALWMAYIWRERLINVISEWIFNLEPIRENKIVPYILRTMHVTFRVETKKLPHSSGITPWRIQFRISCHYHRKETHRERKRDRREKVAVKTICWLSVMAVKEYAELEGKPVRNFWVTWNAVGWLCVCVYSLITLFIYFVWSFWHNCSLNTVRVIKSRRIT